MQGGYRLLGVATGGSNCLSLSDKSSSDEIPERDVTIILSLFTYLPLNYDTPVLPEYFLSNAYLLRI